MKSTIKASQLKRRIQIQEEATRVPNSGGGYNRTWIVVPGCNSVPCSVSYPLPSKKGDEALMQQQVQTSIFATFTIRYRPSTNINAAMRIVYGTRIFNIRTIYPIDEERQTITIQGDELQAQGTLH